MALGLHGAFRNVMPVSYWLQLFLIQILGFPAKKRCLPLLGKFCPASPLRSPRPKAVDGLVLRRRGPSRTRRRPSSAGLAPHACAQALHGAGAADGARVRIGE